MKCLPQAHIGTYYLQLVLLLWEIQTKWRKWLMVEGLKCILPAHFHPFLCFLIHSALNGHKPPLSPGLSYNDRLYHLKLWACIHLSSFKLHKIDILSGEGKGYRSHGNNLSFWSARRHLFWICKIINWQNFGKRCIHISFSEISSNYVFPNSSPPTSSVWLLLFFVLLET